MKIIEIFYYSMIQALNDFNCLNAQYLNDILFCDRMHDGTSSRCAKVTFLFSYTYIIYYIPS